MNLREAAQQALEALEAGDWYIDQLEMIVYSADDTGTHEERAKVQAAITALRTALAEPEQEPVAVYLGHRATPEGTREFWGVADKPLPPNTPLYTHPVDDTALLRKCLDAISDYELPGHESELIAALRERLALSDAALLAPKPGQLKDRGQI